MPILDMAVSSFAWLIPICLIGAALYTWLLYGNDFSGRRAQTGVYLVYVTNEDGSATCVTRLLLAN